MFKNFALTSVRYLLRNKSYTLINALGLSIGIACCIVIFVMYRFENSFDAYHSKASSIHWVVMQKETGKGIERISRTFYPLGTAMRQAVTGLEGVTSVHYQQHYQVGFGQNKFGEMHAFFVDSFYDKVFDLTWLAGNPKSALNEIDAVVITDKFARQYFGKVSPMGKMFVIDNKLQVTVTGIVAAPPINTDHPYRILLPYAALERFLPAGQFSNWERTGNGATYFVLSEQGKLSSVRDQLELIKRQYLPQEAAKKTQFQFVSLRNMHLRNGDYYGFNYEFPEPVLIMLSVIAGLIAFISCLNFVNLATAQALKRSREIGVRKTFGSNRRLLILQFMSENFIITLLSVIFGILIAKGGMLKLNSLVGIKEQEVLQFRFWQDPSIIGFTLLLTAGVTLLAGLYPSIVMARFKPMEALRGQISVGRSRGVSFRKSLITLQFIAAQAMVLITLIILNQINYLSAKPVGFDTGSIALLNLPEDNEKKAFLLSNQLRSLPGIVQVSVSSAFPLGGSETISIQVYDSLPLVHQAAIFYVDEKYLSTFGLKLLAGKPFSNATPPNEIIVNQTLLKKIGLENPRQAIGQSIKVNEEGVIIAGVVRDYSTDSFSKTAKPLVLQHDKKAVKQVALKIAVSQKAALMKQIQDIWQTVYPEYVYKYTWINDVLSPKDGFFSIIFDILRVFSGIAIGIACLGLYNFAAFLVMQRTKEIGVRKVLGATEEGIIFSLVKSLLGTVIIAFLVASPFAYVVGKFALQEFSDRVEPGVWLFTKVLFGTLLLSFLAVGYRSYRAAHANPVQSLKHN